MGMDVIGRAPSTETGEYFRRNVWGWRPLWDYVEDMHVDLADKVEYAQSNDGDGLDADDAVELSARLYSDIADGTAERYVKERDAVLAALPDKSCEYCKATGTRTDEVGVKMGMVEKRWCNGCDGKGSVRPFEALYPLEVSDIREFASFLESCGGFSIY
jgi:hypothetical protein